MIREFRSFQWSPRWRMSMIWPTDSRHMMHCSLLRILAIAHAERLDPARLISNLAEEHRGRNRRLLRRLSNRLSDGMSVISALEQTPEVLNEHHVLAIRFAVQTGTTQATYQELIRNQSSKHSTFRRDLRNTTLYFGAMAFAATWIACFVSIVFYPLLKDAAGETLRDEWTPALALMDWGNRNLGAFMLLLPIVIFVALVGLWTGPVAGRLQRLADRRFQWVQKRRIAELLDLLALTIAAGRPLSGALSTLARYHFDQNIRLRLLFVRNEVEQGAGVWDSFQASELLSAKEAAALTMSSSPLTLVWLMRQIASRKREQATLFSETAARLLQILTVLIIAATVLLISTAVYQSIAHLIYISESH